ncbi:MAG: hypothetical protein RIQ81_2161 [Pseudomonadota bacterium]|jgi:DNA primase
MTQGSGSIDDLKDRILSRTSLESLAGESIALKKGSGRLIGLCPFHAEKTPSFHVFPDRYYCFGCKAKGDIIDFVRQTKGMGFIDALKFLCQKYGVEAPELESSRLNSAERHEEAAQIKALLAAHEEFKANIKSPAGEHARKYLEKRGFSPAQIEEYGFGLTPAEGWGLVKKLRALGFQERDLKAASLGTTSEKTGRLYDFFRDNRVMIPIRDSQGRLVAFGGRTLGDHPAKYINSRETKLFDKSALLFGMDRARQAIRQKQRAFIVEGYMDVLQLWAHGIPETVACMGTALTVRHLNLLKAASTTAYLLFDGDAAGQKASMLALEANLQVPEMKLKVIQLPQGQDPDEFVREQGAAGVEKLVEASVDLLDFAISSRLRGASQAQIPALVTREFIPWLVRIGDRIQKGVILSRISELSGLSRETLAAEARMHMRHVAQGTQGVQATRKSPSTSENSTTPAPTRTAQPLDRVDLELLGHIYFGTPEESGFDAARSYIEQEARWDAVWIDFAGAMFDILSSGKSPATVDATELADGSDEVTAFIEKSKKTPAAWKVADRGAAVARILGDIRIRSLRKTIEALRMQVAAASRSPESAAECMALLASILEMNSELKRLETRNPG